MNKYTYIVVTFLFVAQATAQEIVDTPVLVPLSPTVGQPVAVELHDSACVIYLTENPVVINRSGSHVTLIVQALVFDDGSLCNVPPASVLFDIGSFPAGLYSLTVQAQYPTFHGTVTQTLGTIAFSVGHLNPAPAITIWGALALIALLATGASLQKHPPSAR